MRCSRSAGICRAAVVMVMTSDAPQENIVRYLKEICLFLIWGASLVITITTAARQIPAEREQRTLLDRKSNV